MGNFVCPNCGAELPAEATFCRQCGASEESGWDLAEDYRARLPVGYGEDDDFDYDEYLADEFPQHADPRHRKRVQQWFTALLVLLVCLALILWTILK